MQNIVNTRTRPLGDDLHIGALGFGCWRLVAMSADEAQQRLEMALDNGMNLVDTADVYGLDWGGQSFGEAEAILGEVLRQAPHLRERMVLATKGGIIPGVPYDSAYLEQACDDSLRRLGVEQLDLYQIHRPDMLTHPEELANTLSRLRASGKIREAGVSNYSPSQTAALMAYLPFSLASQQPQYSALHWQPLFDGTFDQCMQHQQTVLAWSPLAGGRLAGQTDVPTALAEVLQQLAEREQVGVSAIALAYVLSHPAQPVAIVGSTDLTRIHEAQQALQVTLSRADVYQILQAAMGESLP